jgi:hypothetical protein
MLFAPAGLSACGPTREVSVDIPFNRTLTSFHLDHEQNDDFYCGIRVGGLAGEELNNPPNVGTVVAGFENRWNPGADPFPCYEKIDHAYRGGVFFDLERLDAVAPSGGFILSARLTFRELQRVAFLSDGGPPLRSGRPCKNELMVATAIWSISFNDLIPGDDVTPVPLDGSAKSIDVTRVVQWWRTGRYPNFGFVIRGSREDYARDNAACWSQYGDFKLHVTALVPQ